MNRRLITLKTILWAIVGVLATVTTTRFLFGLGATTTLSDATPWGMWIAFDVMAGVALAAGGFVLAATVYIFGRAKYHSFARPAILTAFLGYIAVAVGLMYDLGLPWNIWHPVVYPQIRSVLFEVAACVILYLTVLTGEFAPVILEHPTFDRPLFRSIHHFLKRITIPLVIMGIVLSTLHQSSLGSLFLIAPYRLHVLWYSPIIWILFFLSAVGLGLMMVTAESFFSAWLFGHKLKLDLLSGLGRGASVVLLLYAAVRLIDLAVRGVLDSAIDGSWQSYFFLSEISLSAVIPGLLLLFRKIRNNPAVLATCSAMTIAGMIGYRFDVCLVAFYRPEDMSYFPSWMEFSVSLGIVALAMLVFIFFIERLKVYPEEEEHQPDQPLEQESRFEPASVQNLLPSSLSTARRFSLAWISAAALAVLFLPYDALFGKQLAPTAVSQSTTVEGYQVKRLDAPGQDLRLAAKHENKVVTSKKINLMVIDGNRNGQLTLFGHDQHIQNLGQQDSCGTCHHQNMPFDKNSSCHECHRDMYLTTDTFDHGSHIDKLGDQSCQTCHTDPNQVKTRQTSLLCSQCHEKMLVANSFIKKPKTGLTGFAVGYMDAMHGLCVECHKSRKDQEPNRYSKDFAQCSRCHQEHLTEQRMQSKPYVTVNSE